MSKNKALVKSTGKILDIKHEYVSFKVDVSFGSNYSEKLLKSIFDSYKIDIDLDYNIDTDIMLPNDIKFNTTKGLEINKYVLSDGSSYDKSELIVGIDNIRDSKLDNIIQDGI